MLHAEKMGEQGMVRECPAPQPGIQDAGLPQAAPVRGECVLQGGGTCFVLANVEEYFCHYWYGVSGVAFPIQAGHVSSRVLR